MSDIESQCWRLHVRGQSAWQIAQAYELPVGEVDLILQRRLAVYGQRPSVPLRGHVEKLVDEVNQIRQAAWTGWDRSRIDKVKTVEKTTSGGTQDGKSEGTISTEAKEGDSPFLRVLIECNRRESCLRGIERPTRAATQSVPNRVDIDTMLKQVEAENAGEDEMEATDRNARGEVTNGEQSDPHSSPPL